MNDINDLDLMADLLETVEIVYEHASYYELKRDRKQLLEIKAKAGELEEFYLKMLVDTLHDIDAKLAKFSGEERAIYDAVYGG